MIRHHMPAGAWTVGLHRQCGSGRRWLNADWSCRCSCQTSWLESPSGPSSDLNGGAAFLRLFFVFTGCAVSLLWLNPGCTGPDCALLSLPDLPECNEGLH